MIHLHQALSKWGTHDFEAVLKQEIAQHAEKLPLQQAMSSGSYVLDTPVTVVINHVSEMRDVIRVRVGVFFQSVIGGCSCADDPTPVSEINEYCEVQIEIKKATAETEISLA